MSAESESRYIDQSGNTVIEPGKFFNRGAFSEGLASVGFYETTEEGKLRYRVGLLDKRGQLYRTVTFSDDISVLKVYPFSVGLARVSIQRR